MSINHHPACTCPLCTGADDNLPEMALDPMAVTVKAFGIITVDFEAMTIFTAIEDTCIEDQAVQHMKEQLGLSDTDSFTVKELRCFVIEPKRRMQ